MVLAPREIRGRAFEPRLPWNLTARSQGVTPRETAGSQAPVQRELGTQVPPGFWLPGLDENERGPGVRGIEKKREIWDRTGYLLQLQGHDA